MGYGEDLSIAEYARIACEEIGYAGRLVFDAPKPEGTPKKLLDSRRLAGPGMEAEAGFTRRDRVGLCRL